MHAPPPPPLPPKKRAVSAADVLAVTPRRDAADAPAAATTTAADLLPPEAPLAAPSFLPSSDEVAMAVGPSMAAAVQAAEDRWSTERDRLESEIAELKAGRARDAESLAQSGALVSMLQETHAALIASNEQLLSEAREVASRHELEAAEFQRNFDELAAEIVRMRAAAETVNEITSQPPKAAPKAAKTANAAGGGAVKSKVVAAAGVGGGNVRRSAMASKGKEN